MSKIGINFEEFYKKQRKEFNIDDIDVNKILVFNPIQDGHFWGCSLMGGGKKALPP